MKLNLTYLLNKIINVKGEFDHAQNYLEQIDELREKVKTQGAFPAGHYYSPIPCEAEISEHFDSCALKSDIPEIELNRERQFTILQEYQNYYHELPFSPKPQDKCRYYYDNDMFSYSDAIFLYSFLRMHKPRRVVEVGSGFSSAVMLDTFEIFSQEFPKITFIEPYPDRLYNLLRKTDMSSVSIIEDKIQHAPMSIFSSLEAGDLLFIDSSHVVKCGSDLHMLMFQVLPLLPSGVFVHFHDVFYPFDYPKEWLDEGRYWNENYFLRAFLAYNDKWSIYFFNTYVALHFGDFIRKNFPLCTLNPGGSLYLKKL